MFDIFLHPIHLVDHQEQPDLPGFLAINAPRRAPRNRSGDIFIVLISPDGPTTPFPLFLQNIPQKLADAYFITAGSVTAGMRTALESINEELLKYNLDNVRSGQTLTGIINMAVLHNDQIYIVHAGNAHSVVVSQNAFEDLWDPQADHGIGVSQSTALRYYQTQVQAGEILLFWNDAPDEFISNLQTGAGKYSLEQLRRRVLNLAQAENRAVILQFQPGKGQLRFLKPRSGQHTVVENMEPAILSDLTPPVSSFQEEIVGKTTIHLDGNTPPVIDAILPDRLDVKPPVEEIKSAPQISSTPESGTVSSSTTTDSAPEMGVPLAGKRRQPQTRKPVIDILDKVLGLFPGRINTRSAGRVPKEEVPAQVDTTIADSAGTRQNQEEFDEDYNRDAQGENPRPFFGGIDWFLIRRRLASILQGGRHAKQRIDQDGKQFLGKVIPGETNDIPRLSPAMMLFIAVAVPLIVVVMATTIYFQNGPEKQHQTYLAQAKTIADQSKKQSDDTIKYQQWLQVIGLLDKAEKFQLTDSSRTLRIQYQQKVDDFESIFRLGYQPIAINLDSSVVVSRMEANASEVYLLDSTQGKILRLARTGQGYSYNLDNSFNCGPGNVGTNSIGPLVGLTLLPPNSTNNATILSMDSTGNLLFCIPGSQPLFISLPDPEKGVKLGNVVNYKLDGENLYVLDSKNNAIYIYVGNNLGFSDRPHLFFDLEVPNLKNVIDMEINGEDLFLLHEDGLMSRCTFRLFTFSQTRCVDPSPYRDTRKGRVGDVQRFKNTHFTLIQATVPPDPSLFLLDDLTSSVFQFGLSQTLHRQLRMQIYPDFTLPYTRATAFTVSTDNLLWIAYGNAIFFTQLQ